MSDALTSNISRVLHLTESLILTLNDSVSHQGYPGACNVIVH